MNNTTFDLSLPVDDPLTPDTFFAERSVTNGIKPCRRLACGTAGLADAVEGDRLEQAITTLHDMWDAGFLFVDTAPLYGNAECVVGEALRRWRGPQPIVNTKFGREADGHRDHDPQWLAKSFDRSVQRLEGSRIDMLAVHEPERCPDTYREDCIEMVKNLQAQGVPTAVGLGGGGPAVRQWLPSGAFQYIITYCRVNALSLQGLTDAVPLAQRFGVSVLVASPTFFGLLGSRHEELMAKQGQSVFAQRAQACFRLADEAYLSVPQMAIRFVLSMPTVDFVLCGPAGPTEAADCREAYEAGPLPADLYHTLWQTAQEGTEPLMGG